MFEFSSLILPITIGVFAFALLYLIVFVVWESRERVTRLRRCTESLHDRESAKRQPLTTYLAQKFHQIAASSFERISILKGEDAGSSMELMRAAGFHSRDSIVIYAFLKLALPIIGFFLGILWFALNGQNDSNVLVQFCWVCGIALVLSKSPDFYLTQRKNRRFKQIRRAFPDMLELLVIASESGLSANPSLSRVAREMRVFSPVLAFELQQLVIELSFLPSRTEAWRNLSDRLPLSEIMIFANALIQAERYGTPFAGAMRTLMRDERAGRLLKIEEQAGRAPALMTVPLILFIMPPLFIVLIGPAVLSILDNIMDGGFG